MRLLTVGDSFTYGEELSDLTLAWPFQLSATLGYDVTNLAKPGSGNTRMVRYAVENITKYDMIIVAWTHWARTEIADECGFYDIWPGCSPIPHKEHTQWRSDLIEYYSRHYNDEYLYRQYLLNIILLQNYFSKNNKKYLMLDAFANHQYRGRKTNEDLIGQIDTGYFVGWPDESMMEWTYGCNQGPIGHFLELGHQRVAEKIYNHMVKLKWAV